METAKEIVTSDRPSWQRLLYMLLFVVIYEIVKAILLVSTVVQFVIAMSTGNRHAGLLQFCDALGEYARQLVHYLTMVTEHKPFPFNSWPDSKQQA